VGLTQSFMRCGGHSLSAIALVRACRADGLAITVQDLLTGKTIRQLSENVDDFVLLENVSQHESLSFDVTQPQLEYANLSHEDVETVYPCTSVQQGFLLSQARNGPNYHSQFLFEIMPVPGAESVDLPRFVEAWQKTINRHVVLQTAFLEVASASEGTLYYQAVLKHFKPTVPILERNINNAQEILDSIEDDAPFTPGKPQHQMSLYKTPTGQIFCRLELSHALYDGISFDILLRDLVLAYDYKLADVRQPTFQAFCTRSPSLTKVDDLAYWKSVLSDIDPCFFPALLDHDLKEKKVRPLSTSTRLDASEIHNFCVKREITPSSLFHAAWALVLKSFTGQDDVCFGYATAGRDVHLEDMDDAVGVFINVLVCRSKVDNSDQIGTLLEKLQTDLADGLGHQNTSLADIQHSVHGQPLFNSMVSFQREMNSDNDSSIAFKHHSQVEPTEVCIFFSLSLCHAP